MAVMRVHKNKNYTVMSNNHFKEKKMSLKAKGLLSLMLSLPDDWDYSVKGLATLSKDGKDSVMSALKELEEFGYLKRTKIINKFGHFKGYDYDIFECPIQPKTEKPDTDEPKTEDTQQLNKKELTTKETKIKDKKDKRAEALDILELEKPNVFTRELIKADYIEEDNLFIAEFNEFFNEMAAEYGLEVLRSCLWYFVSRIKNNGVVDEFGNPINSKLSYMRISIKQGAQKLTKDFAEVPESLSYFLQ